MFRMLAIGLLVVAVGIVVFAAEPWQNADCLDTGDWVCLRQGKRICGKLQYEHPEHKCTGECYNCDNVPGTLPTKMCFEVEGETCTPVDPYVCAGKFPDGECIIQEEECICKTTKAQTGTCNFTSCDE